MKSILLRGAFAAVLLAALCASPAPALEIAEVRGDFYYDSDGTLVGHRHAQLPEGLERRPMSHREKFELMGLELPPMRANLRPRHILDKPASIEPHENLMMEKVIVKFADGMEVRLRSGALRAGGVTMPDVEAVLSRYPDAALQRLFSVEERILDENKETGERLSGQELADLNNFYLLQFETPSARGADLANELNELPFVELAYLQAKGEPAACGDISPTTPSWYANQNYLGPAPGGIDSEYAWAYHAGGDGPGPGFWVCDLEWGWCTTHEDLDFDATDVINGLTGASDVNHGTAVLGEIGGCSGNWGVTGTANHVSLKASDFDSEVSWAANITTADAFLVSGEVMLLEIHIWGVASGLTCVCNCGQFEYVPVEFDLASFNAIQTATSNGIIVVEAGGNGSMDLDHSRYGGAFNRNIRDSGAIIVGAGVNASHVPECWTDYGSRIDVHAYGSGIYTTGYGDLFNLSGCSQDYTFSFGGTSGASPIIVGASVSLQGISQQKYGTTLSPAQVRQALPVSGTPQGAPTSKNIGPMPNLVNAINWIEPDVVSSYVPSGWTYPLVPRSVNDATGSFAPLQTGALPGNSTGTYWNWNERNQSYSFTPTINEPQCGLYLENTLLWFALNSNLVPGGWQWTGNVGPNFVKGGRHTVRAMADYAFVEDEWSEANNSWARQFIWSPLVLSQNTPVTRTYDPIRTSTGSGPYENMEGFSGTTGSPYWYAFASLPSSSSSDFDMRLHTEVPMNIPQQGFGASVASSGHAGPNCDFVILNRNVVASGTYYAGCVNWSGTANKVMEFDGDQGVISNPGINGPYTLGAGEVVDLHEVAFAAGVPTRVEIEWISGDADYGLSVYQPTSGFAGKFGYVSGGYSDVYGPGGDEFVVVNSATGSWHGIVVWKKNADQLNEAVSYNVIVSPMINLTHATPSGWYGPVVPRNTTDATAGSAPLPATLLGNTTTTSYNFSTLNQGPGTPTPPWQTNLYLDDFWSWQGPGAAVAQGTSQLWINTAQGFDPFSLVRGGRHHVRLEADDFDEVAELPETDNQWVDWFVWTPLDLADQAPLVRDAPPIRGPVGYGPYESVDGYRATGATFWTAVGVLPFTAADDYDVRMYAPSTGSKDGFGAEINWSGDATDGEPDFCIVNYNLTSGAYDFGAVNWNGAADDMWVQRADGPFLASVPNGVTRYGPFTLDPADVLDLWEFHVPAGLAGQPIHISVNNLAGGTDLGLIVFDGATAYHTKLSGFGYADANGDGADEHLSPISVAGGFYALAVHKHDWADGPKSAEYELVFSTTGSAVEVPVLSGPAPAAFSLSTPRPNPFGRTTVLELAVPEGQGAATVSVFDLQGRRIATLAENETRVGRYQLSWDGRDSSGRDVAAGVYFVRMETGAKQETRKITLLR